MKKIKSFFKNLARKVLLKVNAPAGLKEIYENLGSDLTGERTFYLGQEKRRVTCLKMESAPGTSETVIQLLKKEPSGSSILDFGCGQHKSEYLRRMGFNVHSCDVFDFQISNYTKIDPKETKLPFLDKSFDIVVVSEVIEHVESPFALLGELARVAKNYLIVTSPNPQGLKSRKEFFKTGYLYWFAPENFNYHISPVFSWQVEHFCLRHNFLLEQVLGNHEVFGLETGEILKQAEALIYKIKC